MTEDLPLRAFTVWRISSEVWGDIVEYVKASRPGEEAEQDTDLRIVWQGMASHAGEARRLANAEIDAKKGEG